MIGEIAVGPSPSVRSLAFGLWCFSWACQNMLRYLKRSHLSAPSSFAYFNQTFALWPAELKFPPEFSPRRSWGGAWKAFFAPARPGVELLICGCTRAFARIHSSLKRHCNELLLRKCECVCWVRIDRLKIEPRRVSVCVVRICEFFYFFLLIFSSSTRSATTKPSSSSYSHFMECLEDMILAFPTPHRIRVSLVNAKTANSMLNMASN